MRPDIPPYAEMFVSKLEQPSGPKPWQGAQSARRAGSEGPPRSTDTRIPPRSASSNPLLPRHYHPYLECDVSGWSHPDDDAVFGEDDMTCGHFDVSGNAPVEGIAPSPMRSIVRVIAGIGIFLGVNALLVVGGGAIEAGADGLTTPGYSQSGSWFLLVIGILAWLALASIVIVQKRMSRRHDQDARSGQLGSGAVEDNVPRALAE
jgi:hypothetical protein